MRRLAAGVRVVSISLVICALCAGLVLFASGCPTPPGCTSAAQCDDGLYCTGVETCVNGACADGALPCLEGEVCLEATDSCTTACTTPADCPDDGNPCTVVTCTEGACLTSAVENCCETDADCEEGEFCDVQANECTVNQNLYEVTKVDADYPERVHFEPAGHTTCTVCHHAADAGAGLPDAAGQSCRNCHPDDPNQPNSFKDIAHDANESGDGCRMCHGDEFDAGNCAFCHPDAP